MNELIYLIIFFIIGFNLGNKKNNNVYNYDEIIYKSNSILNKKYPQFNNYKLDNNDNFEKIKDLIFL